MATKMKWTNELVLGVIGEARNAGRIAAQQKLEELQNKGPKWAVKDGNKIVGTMLDVCGFANLKISARGKFFQLAKKLSANVGCTGSIRFHCVVGYYGGGRLSIFDCTNSLYMSVKITACEAQAKVLEAYGINVVRVESRID